MLTAKQVLSKARYPPKNCRQQILTILNNVRKQGYAIVVDNILDEMSSNQFTYSPLIFRDVTYSFLNQVLAYMNSDDNMILYAHGKTGTAKSTILMKVMEFIMNNKKNPEEFSDKHLNNIVPTTQALLYSMREAARKGELKKNDVYLKDENKKMPAGMGSYGDEAALDNIVKTIRAYQVHIEVASPSYDPSFDAKHVIKTLLIDRETKIAWALLGYEISGASVIRYNGSLFFKFPEKESTIDFIKKYEKKKSKGIMETIMNERSNIKLYDYMIQILETEDFKTAQYKRDIKNIINLEMSSATGDERNLVYGEILKYMRASDIPVGKQHNYIDFLLGLVKEKLKKEQEKIEFIADDLADNQ